WLGESLSNGYFFFYFSIIVVVWLAWFVPWRRLLPVVITWIAAVVIISPILLTYARVQRAQGLHRSVEEISNRGADALDFFVLAATGDVAERAVRLGFVAPAALIACIAAVLLDALHRRRDTASSTLAFYVIATLLAMVLALGPTPRVGGVMMMPSGPY